MKNTIKNILSIGTIGILAFFLISFVNKKMEEDLIIPVKIKPVQHGLNTVLNQEELMKLGESRKEVAMIPGVEKDFVGFKEALAFKESQGNYRSVNTLGYLGKYQFGRSTLRELNIHNSRAFLKDPLLQEKAFMANLKKNKWILRKEIKRFDGKWIKGIKITESGILAAAHLGGAGAVKKFLWSYGKESKTDAYGTKIEHYLKKFSGYDLSDIVANRKPRIE